MGVPAFFRWLVNSSPQVVSTASYKDPSHNPRIDNLYLDMNGIIHPCSHPQGQTTIPAPKTEQEMFQNISRYLDLIFELTDPQKLIYFAIDGVAPRAKMNQQRGRRFRSAQEIIEKKQSQNKIVNDLNDIGYKVDINDMQKESWDHNVITPGTIFMEKVSNFLKSYICKKFQNSQNFEDLVIIYSDSNMPQEGEHKILEFIRSQRNQVGYDPNTSHCIYGADADLIMLGLSTHEPNFYIIREKLEYASADAKRKEETSETFTVQFSFIYIQIVREFLNAQTFNLNKEQKWDLENIIDDFVLLCFIVGNDFLPSLPGFEIRMGGIDILLEFYKKCLKKLNGYLTFQGEVQLQNLEIFFSELAKNEYELMQSIENEKYYHIKRMKEREQNNLSSCRKDIDTISKSKTQIVQQEPLEEVKLEKKNYQTPKQKKKKISEAQEILQDTLKKKKIKSQLKNINNFEQFCIDGENYKQKYYLTHFKIQKEDYLSFTNIIKRYYIEGIVWNFHYYYKGCCSWNWFYPFHYAPLISDLNNFSYQKIEFDKGVPFTPLQQLLSVLPPFSSHALPKPLSNLMTDLQSDIIDFYPTYFEVDQRGKTVSWLGEVILPFIDGQRLKQAVEKIYNQLTEEEKIRDKLGFNILITKNKDSKNQLQCTLNQIQEDQIFSDKKTIQEQNGLYFYQIDLPQNIQHRCQLLRGVTIPKRSFNISVFQKGKNQQKRFKFYKKSFK